MQFIESNAIRSKSQQIVEEYCSRNIANKMKYARSHKTININNIDYQHMPILRGNLGPLCPQVQVYINPLPTHATMTPTTWDNIRK
jgi:hypothetical protein